MYIWQNEWCSLSVDYFTLRLAYSPILHSVQKKSEPNSCAILCMVLHPTAAIEQTSLWKGAVEWGIIADESFSLAAASVVLWLLTRWYSDSTEVLLHLKKGTTLCRTDFVWRHRWFSGTDSVPMETHVHRNHFRYPAKRASVFLPNFGTSLLDCTSSYPKYSVNASKYTDCYVFKNKREI
jgi:hypothetical protein